MNGYIRKVVSIVLVLIFCVAVIAGASTILSVRNINIEYVYYSSEEGGESFAYEEYVVACDNLNSLKGKNLIFLDDSDITDCIGGNIVYLESFEKVFPCTINVVLKEKLEQYSRPNASGGYDIYDSNGEFIETRDENINPVDSSPNVLIDVDDDQVFSIAVEICTYFKEQFGSLRNLVKTVTASYDSVLDTTHIILTLYSGLTIDISDYEEYAEEKISKVYEVYSQLQDNLKLRGSIFAVSLNEGVDGNCAAEYFGT